MFSAYGRYQVHPISKIAFISRATFLYYRLFLVFVFLLTIDPFHVYVNEVELEDKTITRSDV